MAHQVTISWTASTDPVSGYNVLRGTATGQETTVLTATPITTTTYTDTTVTPGQWFYVVESVLNGVSSLASNEISVSLRPAPPTALTLVSDN